VKKPGWMVLSVALLSEGSVSRIHFWNLVITKESFKRAQFARPRVNRQIGSWVGRVPEFLLRNPTVRSLIVDFIDVLTRDQNVFC
jgi:hypothetical protein